MVLQDNPNDSLEQHTHIVSSSTMKSWHKYVYDSFNRPRTVSLFWEFRAVGKQDTMPCFFTLKDRPHTVQNESKTGLVTYPSLKQIYMSYDHIPGFEYDFATEVFGSWEVWEKLLQSQIKKTFFEWRDELTIKLKSNAVKKILHMSKESSSAGATAARYIADEGYVQRKVGRMTKEEKARQLKIDAGVRDDLADDMARLGITVVSGGK